MREFSALAQFQLPKRTLELIITNSIITFKFRAYVVGPIFGQRALQHWGESGKMVVSPEGTAEGSRAVSAAPAGHADLGTDQPNVETLGLAHVPPGHWSLAPTR
jgi:hypothetical protein